MSKNNRLETADSYDNIIQVPCMCTYAAAAENGKGSLKKKLLLIGITPCQLSYVIPNALPVSILP